MLGSTPAVHLSTRGNAYNTDVQYPKARTHRCPRRSCHAGSNDGIEVFTRDPQVGLFRVWRTAVGVGAWFDVYAISNHFSSTPDGRVAQGASRPRTSLQIVDALGVRRTGRRRRRLQRLPRPDDPLQSPSDQLDPLYDQGLLNLWDTMVAQVPAAAYSYVFLGHGSDTRPPVRQRQRCSTSSARRAWCT